MRIRTAAKTADWLALGEASRLLGVAPGTLRRWTNTGEITSFTTPGGHRRYRRTVIERIIHSREAPTRAPLLSSGLSAARLAREYRRAARHAGRDLPWLGALSTEQREWFRVHGRRLAQALLEHLDRIPADRESAETALTVASADAAEYGRMASGLGLSLSQSVEGFLEFRRPFLQQLAVFANQRGLDAQTTTELIAAAERALDRLLLAAMAGHNVEAIQRQATHRGAETETEGIR